MSTSRAFFRAPLHFLILQIPATSVELISDFLLPEGDWRIPIAIALLFPYLCITSTLSASLTFASVMQVEKKQRPSLAASWEMLRGKLKTLVPVSMTTGLVLILGLMTVFVMLFHYMAIYLFVPQLLVTEPRLPWSVYLHRSRKLVKGSYGKAVTVVTAMLFLSLGGDALAGTLAYVFSLGDSPAIELLLLAVKYGFSLASTALLAIWISYYFLTRRALLV